MSTISRTQSSTVKPLPKSVSTIVDYFDKLLHDNNNDYSIGLCSIQSLIHVIETSESTTLMELQLELRASTDILLNNNRYKRYITSLQSGCELLQRNVTRFSNDILNSNDKSLHEFSRLKQIILDKAKRFQNNALNARTNIANTVNNTLFKHYNTHNKLHILIHGYSRVVIQSLIQLANNNKQTQITLYITSADFTNDTNKVFDTLKQYNNIQCISIDSNSVVYYISLYVEFILSGAENVTENGGIINQIGTLNIALIAKSYNKPLYILSESYKFARIYPLTQHELVGNQITDNTTQQQQQAKPLVDYTQPEYIELLITDIGVLPPSAVSDELIKLYY